MSFTECIDRVLNCSVVMRGYQNGIRKLDNLISFLLIEILIFHLKSIFFKLLEAFNHADGLVEIDNQPSIIIQLLFDIMDNSRKEVGYLLLRWHPEKIQL